MTHNIIVKMANTNSIKKTLNYLRKKQVAVSPSEIAKEAVLKYRTVMDVLEILEMTNQVFLLSNGKNTLVQLKSSKNEEIKNE